MSNNYNKIIDSNDIEKDHEGNKEVKRPLEYYLDDDCEDEPSNESCWKRYFSLCGKGSLRGSIFSLASLSLGIRVFSYPIAFTNVGLVSGLIMLVLLFLGVYWTVYILVIAARRKKILNFGLLTKEVLGEKWFYAGEIVRLIYIIMLIIGFIFTMSKFFIQEYSNLSGVDYTSDRNFKFWQMLLFMVFIQIPLSTLRDMKRLQYVSMVMSLNLIYTAFVILIQTPFYYQEHKKDQEIVHSTDFGINYFDTIMLFMFSFSNHKGVFNVLSDLKKPTLRRCTKVIWRGQCLQLFIFIIIGLGGYFSFINPMPELFLARPNLSIFPHDYPIMLSKFLITVCLNGAVAIFYNIIRSIMKELVFKRDLGFNLDLIMIVVIFASCNFLAYVTTSFVSLLSITGGIFSGVINTIIPCLLYLYTSPYEKYHWKNVTTVVLMFTLWIGGLISSLNVIFESLWGPIFI